MTGITKEAMTEMTGVIPVRGYTTSDAATDSVIRMIVDRFADTEWIYSLSPEEARHPDRPIYFEDSWEVPIRIWVAHPELRYGRLWETLEAILSASSLTVVSWGSDHTPGML